jgi:hypothetical protein
MGASCDKTLTSSVHEEQKKKSINMDDNNSKSPKESCLDLKDEGVIYGVYELSNKRIAVLFNNKEKEVKIYSLENWNLITKINQDFIKKIIELKNNDLVINSNSKIYFYKLLPNQNYELYQTIDEYEQGTFKEKLPFLKGNNEKDYSLNSIYQLINEDLVSCNSYGIKIYKKDSDNKYKLSYIKEIKSEIVNAFEIKKNTLILFSYFCENISETLFYDIFSIYKYNIENQEITELSVHDVKDDECSSSELRYFNHYMNNNYLFVRYGYRLEVYNQDANLIYQKECSKFETLPILKFLCNYGDNLFIAENFNKEIKIFIYKNNNFEEVKNCKFAETYIKGALKLKNNDFIFYSYSKINLIKNLD